jgi:hypothetical protein
MCNSIVTVAQINTWNASLFMECTHHIAEQNLAENPAGSLSTTPSKLFNRNNARVIGLIHHTSSKYELIEPIEVSLEKADGSHLFQVDVPKFLLE